MRTWLLPATALFGRPVDELAARLLPGRFTRLNLTPDRMPSLYQSADVFLHLSKQEWFGNVFVEAMACGLPIVTHNSSRLRWIVGESEFLLDTDDPAAVARHIGLACRSPASERQARAQRAASFSWSKIGGYYREFLTEVVPKPDRLDQPDQLKLALF